MAQPPQELKHQTIAYSNPLPLQEGACQAQDKDTLALKERH